MGKVGGHILSMSNRLVNNHCQQERTKDQKSAIVIFGQCRELSQGSAEKRDTSAHPPLLLALVSSPSSLLTIGKPAALPGRATGSPQPACGLQTFFGRAGVAAERPGPRGPSEAALSPRAPPVPPHLPSFFVLCCHV